MEEQIDSTKEESSQWSNHLSQLSEKSRLLFSKLLEKRIPPTSLFQMIYLNQVYQKFSRHLPAQPEKLLDLQLLYWQELFFLWQRFILLQSEAPADQPLQKNEAGQSQPLSHWIRDFYLMHARHFQALLPLSEDLEPQARRQIQFCLKQLTETLSPAPFAATNPDVLQTLLETQGENLLAALGSYAPTKVDNGPKPT